MASSRKIKICLIFLLISALAGEIALRIIKIPCTSYGDWLPVIYQYNKDIGYMFIPNVNAVYKRYYEWETNVKANKEGWRDDEHTIEKPADTFRIACIGDSYTVNLEVQMNENYPKRLEQILKESVSPNIEILNFSIDGTTTGAHYVMLTDYALKYKPDMIIHSFHDSDIRDIRIGKYYRQGYKNMIIQYQTQAELEESKQIIDSQFYNGWAPLKHYILKNSYLSRVLFYLMGIKWPHSYMIDIHPAKMILTEEQAYDKAGKLIKDFKAAADKLNIPYVIAFLHYEDAIRQEGHNPYLSKLKDVIDENNIYYVETYQVFKDNVDKKKLYWKYDAHITPEGCNLIAQTVADYLKQNNLLAGVKK